MDNDTTSGKEGHYKILKTFAEKKADILVGTQMIAKGHDFPSVTLVGILDLLAKIALAIAIAFPALNYASGKGFVWRVIFWIALAVYLFGCIWSFI